MQHISPAQLNATSDADLRAQVDAAINDCERPEPLARFVTMHVLMRLNNMVVDALGGAGLKQATMCRVVQSITGRARERDDHDATYRGNRMGTYIYRYSGRLGPLEEAAELTRKRLERAGKPTEGWDRAVREAQEQLYVCPYGATPQTVSQPTQLQTPWTPADAGETAKALEFSLLIEREKHATEVHELTRAVGAAAATARRQQTLDERVESARKRMLKNLKDNLADAKAKSKRSRQLKAAMAKVKRKAVDHARTVESTSESRLKRLKAAKDALASEVAAHEETKRALDALQQQQRGALATAESPFSITCRSEATGRREPYPWKARVAIMAQLARLTPVRAVARNLKDAQALFAPGTPFREASMSLVYECRQELPLLGESLAAYQVGMAARVMSFGYDASTKLHVEGLSSNTQIMTTDGQVRDVVQRCFAVIPGGEAQATVQSIAGTLRSSQRANRGPEAGASDSQQCAALGRTTA